MAAINYTPPVRSALNVKIINQFGAGIASGLERISGLDAIAGDGTTDSRNIVVFVAGINFRVLRRRQNEDALRTRRVAIYEHRAQLANYVDVLEIERQTVLYDDKIGEALLIADTGGGEVAETPTRMVEALVPRALGIQCHTGEPFFSADHPIRPGSSEKWANVEDLGDLDFASYDEAVERLAGIPDEDGRASASKGTVLAVGRKNRGIAKEIIVNRMPKDYAGGQNWRADENVQLIVVDDWDDDFWGLFDTRRSKLDMPFWLVTGRALQFIPLYTDPMGPHEIETNMLKWAVDGDLAVAIGNPRRAFLSANPANAATIIAKYKKKMDLNGFTFDLDEAA